MKAILTLHRRGLLTGPQLAVAERWRQDPIGFRLTPTLFRVLHDAILKGKSLEEMEARFLWPARAAKAIISEVLNALIESEGVFWNDPLTGAGDALLREQIAYLTGDAVDGRIALIEALGLTDVQARLLLILRTARGGVMPREILLRRLYHGRAEDEIPDPKIIDVHIYNLRARLPEGMRIETLWGQGFRLIEAQ